MHHDMKDPCGKCPFRNDIDGYLTPKSVSEIVENLMRGRSFPCHVTVDYNGDSDGEVTEDSRQCAGAEIFLAHQGKSTQMSRIAERLGMKVAKLNMNAPVCKSMTEMLEVHRDGDEEVGETCAVVDHGCLAPAGYMVDGGLVDGTDYVDTQCDLCGEYVCDNCSTVTDDGQRICNFCQEDEER